MICPHCGKETEIDQDINESYKYSQTQIDNIIAREIKSYEGIDGGSGELCEWVVDVYNSNGNDCRGCPFVNVHGKSCHDLDAAGNGCPETMMLWSDLKGYKLGRDEY